MEFDGQPTSISLLDVPRRPIMSYRREFEFSVSPADLWDVIGEVDHFETWWPWLEEFRIEGGSLEKGAVLHGVIAPPLPYRMRIQIELTRCEPPRRIETQIHGDLEGEANLELRARGAGSSVEVAWTVEMMQRPMRLADRMAHPVLQWGHDRVVEITVAGFRRRLASAD
jgi:uncharacterized protein YndB with AHSA1/START domain